VSTPSPDRFFPYAEPYPNQAAAMDRIDDALAAGRDVLLEGAPGTGKTLAALAPALAHARAHDRTVVITTNVHQQMRQFEADARAIDDAEPIRAVSFRGKESMCHIDVGYRECQALRDATRELVDAERDRAELAERADELLAASREGEAAAAEAREAVTAELDAVEDELEELRAANVCDRYRANLTGDTDAFYGWLFDGVRTPDEVYGYADERGFCGYELLKEGMEAVDLVVCNYHHLLEPGIREQFFRWLGREPGEVIAVFDEAHNVEAAAREHAGRSCSERTFDAAVDELSGVDDPRAGAARNVLGAFRDALAGSYDAADAGGDWTDVPVANDDRRDDLTLAFLDRYGGAGIDADVERAVELGEELDERYAEAYRSGEATSRRESDVLAAASFLADWMAGSGRPGRHPVVGVRRDAGSGEAYGRAELYACLPGEVTRGLFDEVAASVLMSATLRPFDVTASVLGLTDPVTTAYGLAYPEERRRTYAVDTPPLFADDRDDPAVQAAVAGALRDAIRLTPGNTLAVFPSYAEAARYHDLLAGDRRLRADVPWDGDRGGARGAASDGGRPDRLDPGARLMLDEPGTRAESLRESFVAADDAALFTSLWGTLSEGVSFDGDAARTVAVVGVAYPRLSGRLDAVQDAYDRAFPDRPNAGWRYGVEVPTVRKTRQALGRVIRSPDDFGARLLLDRRYTDADMGRYGVRDAFPPEERAELIDITPGKLRFGLRNFFADLDAYDGEPPAP